MSKSSSKSSSKSQTSTTTSSTTQQYDQRVAATDLGIAIGPNNQAAISISQLPPEAGTILQGFLDLSQMALTAAQQAGGVAVDAQEELNQVQETRTAEAQNLIFWAVAGFVVFYFVKEVF